MPEPTASTDERAWRSMAFSILVVAAGCARPGSPTATHAPPTHAVPPAVSPRATPRSAETTPVVGWVPIVTFDGASPANVDELARVVRADEEFTEERIAHQLDDDVLALEGVYSDLGYLDAHIEVHVDRDALAAPFLDVVVDVTEGVRYRVGDVEVAETRVAPLLTAMRARPLSAWISLKRAGWFSRVTLVTDIATLAHAYRDAGYADVEVTPVVTRDRSLETVDVGVRIDRGPLVRIERIDVVGARRVPEARIRSALAVKVGGRFDESAIDRSVAALRSTGEFDDVQATTAHGHDPSSLTLVFEVDEGDAALKALAPAPAVEPSLDDRRNLPEVRAASKRIQRVYPYSLRAKDAELRVAEIDLRLEAYELAASELDAWRKRHPGDPRVASVRARQLEACRTLGATPVERVPACAPGDR